MRDESRLSPDQIEMVARVTLEAGLANCREVLFGRLPRALLNASKEYSQPDLQLRADLTYLNRAGPLAGDGGLPIRAWLQAAHDILESRGAPDAQTLADMATTLDDDRALRASLKKLAEARAHSASADVIRGLEDDVAELKRRQRTGRICVRGQRLCGRYELCARLGVGGVGAVWSAFDEEAGETVAVKLLHAHLASDVARRRRLLRGARLMRRLSDQPHVVDVREVHQHDREANLHFIVLELVDGPNLADWVLTRQQSYVDTLQKLVDVARSLGVAHGRDIVHRDVKPENILIDGSGAPRLTDFDTAWSRDTTGATVGVLGTVNYMAPEALHDAATVGPPGDVYALGMTALFIAMGHRLPMLVGRQERGRFIDGLRVTPPVRRVIERAVRERQNERFADASAFASALAAALDAGPTDAQTWRPSLVEVPPGTFTMGVGSWQRRQVVSHPVKISRAYFMSCTPVTRAQYEAVTGFDPSHHRTSPDAPVDSVTWHEALSYCDALSVLEGLSPVYRRFRQSGRVDWGANGYRLPTEAEWERACQADSTWQGELSEYAWYKDGDVQTTQPVARKVPNPFGLYDMVGNVNEWCWDRYGTHEPRPATDPLGPDSISQAVGERRVVRGGDFTDQPGFVGSHERNPAEPGTRSLKYGFRIVRRVPDPIEARSVEPDGRKWLVWNRASDGWTTSMLTAVDGRVRILANRVPGLTIATGGRIWVWERRSDWSWRDVPSSLDAYIGSGEGTKVLLARDMSFRLVDVLSGDVLGGSVRERLGPPPEPPIGIITSSEEHELLACHGGHLYVHRLSDVFAGGAHNFWGCGFDVYDLTTGGRSDRALPTQLVTPDARVRAREGLGRRYEEDLSSEFELTLAYPCYRADGVVGTRLQLTRDACFANSGRLWSAYTASARIDVYPDPKAIMPEIVRAWFGLDEGSFFGYGLVDADEDLLFEVLRPAGWG